MSTIFVGGSRHVSRLPEEAKRRLHNVIQRQHNVLVGDANGIDKAVQQYFADASYNAVTVFCSGNKYRNNVGHWPVRSVDVPNSLKGFQFYAAKDREMAREADFGFMIWDAKSPGTLLNVLRLARAGKITVLYNVPEKRSIDIKTMADMEAFLKQCRVELLQDLQERATPEEWPQNLKPSLSDKPSGLFNNLPNVPDQVAYSLV